MLTVFTGLMLAMRRLLCLMLLSLWLAAPAVAQVLDLHLAGLEHAAFAVQGVSLHMAQDGQASVHLQQLRVAGRQVGPLTLRCQHFSWRAQRLGCRQGWLQLGSDQAGLALEFDYLPQTRQLRLQLHEFDVSLLVRLLPELADWQPRGQARLLVEYRPGQARLELQLQEAAFSNAAGSQAGEGINARLHLDAQAVALKPRPAPQRSMRTAAAQRWQLTASLEMPQGQLFVAPLYRDQPLSWQASGHVDGRDVHITRTQLDLPGWGQLAGSLHWQLPEADQPGRLVTANLLTGPLELSAVLPQLVQPYLGAGVTTGLSAQGTASLDLALDAAGLQRLDIELERVALARGEQGVSGITAHIPWRRQIATQAEIEVAAGHFGKLSLGAFRIPLVMQGWSFDIKEVGIPVLDGRLLLEDFHLGREQDAWHGRLSAAIEPISMPQLTQALGWPQMDGVLSAALPQIRYRDATLELDGQLVVSLFDGYLSASHLRIIEPFGALPRLQADIMARHLDLGMLTRTFSFGDITGYVDADIEGLEMHGMQPLGFAAHVRSSAGDYPRRISQRAVQNISSLGGAGAAAAIQRSFLRIFETFGYQQIGVRCWLKNGVCQMGGIEASDADYVPLVERLRLPGSRARLSSQAYVLIRGGGLPALNVIGYNRRVDWRELTTRLQAVIAGNGRMEMR